MQRIIFLLFVSLVLLSGCTEKIPMSDDEQIAEMLNKNIEGMQNEDIDAVMETTSTGSPMYSTTLELAEKLFNTYDLNYKLLEYKIEHIEGDQAYVSFVQSTTKISGPEFRNNKVTGIHTLKKEDGEWKIFSTRIEDVDYNL